MIILVSCNKKIYKNDSKIISNEILSDSTYFYISGLVIDDLGELPGASIIVKNTTRGVTTNFEGQFKIKVKIADILIVTFSGMKTQMVEIDENKKIYTIKLEPDANTEVIMTAKPVIYLYPKEKTEVTIKLDYKGKIETTFPKYNDNWQVVAYPDGKIYDLKTKRYYTSLFWDGIVTFEKEHYNYKDGFVVKKEELTSFLLENLEKVGLNNIETNEFIQYWLPILEQNEYNFIHFWLNDYYNNTSNHFVTPKPDSEIRLFMEFYKINEPLKVPKQNISKTVRKGFTFVEWGGSDVSMIKSAKTVD